MQSEKCIPRYIFSNSDKQIENEQDEKKHLNLPKMPRIQSLFHTPVKGIKVSKKLEESKESAHEDLKARTKELYYKLRSIDKSKIYNSSKKCTTKCTSTSSNSSCNCELHKYNQDLEKVMKMLNGRFQNLFGRSSSKRSPCKINTQVPLSYKTPQRSNEISMIDENSIESFIACKSNQNQLNRRIASSNVSKPFLSQFE